MGTTLLLLKISANISAYFLATPEFSFFRFSERMLVQNFSYKNKLTDFPEYERAGFNTFSYECFRRWGKLACYIRNLPATDGRLHLSGTADTAPSTASAPGQRTSAKEPGRGYIEKFIFSHFFFFSDLKYTHITVIPDRVFINNTKLHQL